MKKVILPLLFLLGVGIISLSAQNRPKELYRKGELLVRAQKTDLEQTLLSIDGSGAIKIEKSVSPPLDIWLITFDDLVYNEYTLLEWLQQDRRIHTAQLNHIVSLRDTLPNDALIGQQWQYVNDGSNGGVVDADIDMDQAWSITTGGLTALGDTIVVCAIDDGIDLGHVDFEDNLWVNYGEIPNNSIDDDGNGYVDDYKGWNISTLNDNISGGSHGTPVAGIMGAKGNNGIGVSGISWNVKVMVVKNDFNTDEADVIAAYTYPLIMRKRYNASNGAEGAFVVATNASWGIDQGQPSSAPLWCAFYDTLGANGIISCGATANWNYNIDVDGDLPTACPSDYLISVTNMDRDDTKETYAGYGITTIDLGAFGDDTYTTALGNTYEGFGGTSGATPHVTGTVGLLYSLNCTDFATLAKNNPEAAAMMVKNAILDGVDPNSSLTGLCVTGGRLNVFNALQQLTLSCDSNACTKPFGLKVANVTSVSADLVWNSFIDSAYVLRYKSSGELDWTEIEMNTKSYSLTSLKPCQQYEFQVKNTCDSTNGGFSSSYTFKTDGCGNCTALNYCPSYATTSSTLYIKRVVLNTLDNTTGDDDGYRNNLVAVTSLSPNGTYDLTVVPGYSGFSYAAHCKVWIDLDQNGSFAGATEQVFTTTAALTDTIKGTITIPQNVVFGITRMRVALKYMSSINSPCDIIGLGEVEDYCVELLDNTGTSGDKNGADWVEVFPNPFTDRINITLDQSAASNVKIEDVTGRVIYQNRYVGKNIRIELPENLSKGLYFVKVSSGDRKFTAKLLKE